MAKRKSIEIVIKLRDGVTATLAKIRGALKVTAKGFKVFAKVGVAAFAAVGVGAGLLAKTIKTAFNFETLRTQLSVLLGSMDKAKAAFSDLKEFSASTPFELPNIIEAYAQLQNFTEGALNTADGLKLVGDAAAGMNKDFAETAYWTGRLYSALKNGDPFMDSVSALQRMGIVGGTIRGDLEALTSAGADFSTKWGVVEKQLKRLEGGMETLSKTGNGLLSTLKDNWTIAVATFGDAFTEAAKGGIQDMIDKIKQLVDDGTITKWANQAKEALDAVVETIKIVSKGGKGRSEVLASLGNVIKMAFKSAAITAAEVLLKFAPKVGVAIGKGLADLIGINLVPKDIKEQQSIVKELARERKRIRKGSRIEEFDRLNMKPAQEKLDEMVRAWEDGVVQFEAVDLKGALEEFEEALIKWTAPEETPWDTLESMLADFDPEWDELERMLRSVAGEKQPTAIPKKAKDKEEIRDDRLKESDELIRELMRGEGGIGRRESLSEIGEVIKAGGAGQLGEVSALVKDLKERGVSTEEAIAIVKGIVKQGGGEDLDEISDLLASLTGGQEGLTLEQALGVISDILKSGGIGEADDINALIDSLTAGQDQLSREEIGDALSKMFGGEGVITGGQIAGGEIVPEKMTAEEASLEYLRQIAENTKGGLF